MDPSDITHGSGIQEDEYPTSIKRDIYHKMKIISDNFDSFQDRI